mgnify:CR=1 FL=1
MAGSNIEQPKLHVHITPVNTPSVGSVHFSADLHQRTLDAIRMECWTLQIGMERGVVTGGRGCECLQQTVSERFSSAQRDLGTFSRQLSLSLKQQAARCTKSGTKFACSLQCVYVNAGTATVKKASKQPILRPIWYRLRQPELLARSHSPALGFPATTTFFLLSAHCVGRHVY